MTTKLLTNLMTALLEMMQWRPTLTLARSPRIIASDCTMFCNEIPCLQLKIICSYSIVGTNSVHNSTHLAVKNYVLWATQDAPPGHPVPAGCLNILRLVKMDVRQFHSLCKMNRFTAAMSHREINRHLSCNKDCGSGPIGGINLGYRKWMLKLKVNFQRK